VLTAFRGKIEFKDQIKYKKPTLEQGWLFINPLKVYFFE